MRVLFFSLYKPCLLLILTIKFYFYCLYDSSNKILMTGCFSIAIMISKEFYGGIFAKKSWQICVFSQFWQTRCLWFNCIILSNEFTYIKCGNIVFLFWQSLIELGEKLNSNEVLCHTSLGHILLSGGLGFSKYPQTANIIR